MGSYMPLRHSGIIGMKWGVRRYQNKDGSLTELGRYRYARDKEENSHKKKDKQVPTDTPDVNRWVREDNERATKVVKNTEQATNAAQRLIKATDPVTPKKKMDLSNMTEKEMREQINRELLERQYNNLFAEDVHPKVTKGKQYALKTLEIAGGAAAVTASSLSIALAIRELRGK